MTVQHLNTLLEKTSSYDKDERYMATNDLCTELQKDIKIDVTMERRICAAVLKQLDDQSNDVQGLAVKCLGILFKKVQEAQVGEICDKLCSLILDGKSELRDIYSIGLRTLISDVPEAMGKPVAHRLTSRLLSGIEQDKVLEVKLECLDNLTDLLKRFGREVENEHQRIMDVTLRQLGHERPVVRKRGNACIGAFAVVASDALLNRLMESLLAQIDSPKKKGKDVQTLIQTIGTISRTVGYRLGKHLDKVVPLFLRFCGDSDDGEQDEERNELRENCFAAFESVVLRCPREVASHLDAIIDVSLRFMRYDPNYTYGESDDETMDTNGDEAEEEYDEEDYGGSDDDDTSWKVRRSALKVLSAVISSRPEMLKELYSRIANDLIGRFKEREENVRLDVVSCFTCLLKATVALQTRVRSHHSYSTSAQTPSLSKEDSGRWAVSRSLSGDDASSRESEAKTLLNSLLPALIRAANKQLKGPSLKTKSAVLLLLKSLVHVLRGGLASHLDVVMDDLKRCLQDKNQGLKLDALSLAHTLLESHPPEVLNPYLPPLVPLITTCVEDDWYKIIAEALRVVGVVITIIRPIDPSSGMFKGDMDSSSYVRQLYQATFPRLDAHDIDQEIKECAITSIGLLITHLGDHLSSELPQVLSLLMDKLKNEITRMPTLKALARIAHSPLRVDLSPILSVAVTELSQFLRQQSRPLKLTTLETLVALMENYAQHMSPDLFGLVLRECSNLIADSDLHLAHLALQLTVCVLKVSPDSVATVAQFSMPNVLALAGSPLLQGYALRSLLSLLEALVKIGKEGLDFHSLIKSLEEVAHAQQSGLIPKQVLGNLAVCMARISACAPPKERQAFINRLVDNMRADKDLHRRSALLCVGELGAQVDLSSIPNLQNIVLESFGSLNEETKAAAAYALGHLAAGNMSNYLPLILQYLGDPQKPQYLLLLSLKEVILTRSSEFAAHIDQVLPHLFSHAQSPEEGVRNMVSECLGTLSNLHPPRVIGALKDLADKANDNKPTLWTVATALKYSMSSSAKTGAAAPKYLNTHPDLLTQTLKNAIEINVDAATVTSEDLDVQRATLLMVNAAAHHQPAAIAPFLQDFVVPLLKKSTSLTLERKVNLGPFTHTVDDGLPLRKAAFSCLDTMLDTMPNVLEMSAFMPWLATGLADKDDVQLLCHQIVVKICRYSPGAVLGSMDALLDPLEKDTNKKAKDQQVGTEVERTNDIIRSSLRALVAIWRIDGAQQNPKFSGLVERIQGKEHLRSAWTSLLTERSLEG